MIKMAAHSIPSQEIMKFNDPPELLNLLNEFLLCSRDNDKIVCLKKCSIVVRRCEKIVFSNSLVMLLENVIDFAIVPPFTNRDYFSYDKTDFPLYPQITECVLHFYLSVFDKYNTKHDGDSSESLLQKLAKLILKLIILISGNANIKCPLWSSSECQNLCHHLLSRLMLTFNCQASCDFFHLKGAFLNNKETLIESFLSICKEQLSSANWQKNPFLSESFSWIISRITMPYMSNYIGQVMAISLNFLDDHQEVNKLRGIHCLVHLISNTSSEELRWYNQAEVIYNSLKHQIYCKDAAVSQNLFPCLFAILKVLDKTTNLKYHHDVLEEIMRETLCENLLLLRRIYISNLCWLVQQTGVSCIRHICKLLTIVGNFLEIEDGDDELARIGALRLLRVLILIAWPRISQHSQVILKALLKLLIDINGDYYHNGQETHAQRLLNDLALDCLKLLIKVFPGAAQVLLNSNMTKGLKHVAIVLDKLNLESIS